MNENRLSGLGGFTVYAIATALLLFILAPLLVVIVMSFSDGRLAMFPIKGLTFEWYAKTLAQDGFRDAFVLSGTLALLVTAAAALLGIPASYALDRWQIPFARSIEALLLSPLILPSLIIGLAMLQFFSTAGMTSPLINLFVGHVMIALPYMMRTVTASLKLSNRALEEAATTLGAPPATVFLKVTLPQILPGVTAGALFTLMISFDEFPISMWLHNAESVPLPIYLHHTINKVFDPSVAAISSLMVLTGIVTVLAVERIVGLRKAMGV